MPLYLESRTAFRRSNEYPVGYRLHSFQIQFDLPCQIDIRITKKTIDFWVAKNKVKETMFKRERKMQ